VAAPKPQAASQNTTAEAERQRPDLTESSRSESSGHWQRSTQNGHPDFSEAAVQADWATASFVATKLPFVTSHIRPQPAGRGGHPI